MDETIVLPGRIHDRIAAIALDLGIPFTDAIIRVLQDGLNVQDGTTSGKIMNFLETKKKAYFREFLRSVTVTQNMLTDALKTESGTSSIFGFIYHSGISHERYRTLDRLLLSLRDITGDIK